MKQDNFKAPPEPPIEKDDNNVYNFKCEKGDSKYLNLKPNSIDRHMSRRQRKRRIRFNKTIRMNHHNHQ